MIQLQNAGVYLGGKPVLSEIDETFPRGAFTCIIGRNGCGKSTLLRAMAGLLRYEGSVRLFGSEVRELEPKARARLLAYLPQSRTVPQTDVYTLIAHGRYPHMGFAKVLSPADREKIEEAACMTGVQDLLRREVPSLSGGERQRAYLAVTVAQDAEMILLDEPTTYLDVEHQLQVLGLAQKMNRMGKGIVMVAHDLEQAFHFASRLCLIDGGGIAASGSPDALCGDKALQKAMGVAVERFRHPGSVYDYRLVKGDVL